MDLSVRSRSRLSAAMATEAKALHAAGKHAESVQKAKDAAAAVWWN